MRLKRTILIPTVLFFWVGFILLFALSCASLRGSKKPRSPSLADSSFVVLMPGAMKPGTGRLFGTVVDAYSGQGLPGSVIQIVGTKMGAAADLDGSFTIIDIPTGVYTVRVTNMGFRGKTKRGVTIKQDTIRRQIFRLNVHHMFFEEITYNKDPKLQAELAKEEKEIRENLLQYPNDTSAIYDLTEVCMGRGEYKAAIKELRKLVKLKPDDTNLHYRLRDALEKDHQLDEAEKEYRIGLNSSGNKGWDIKTFAEWLVNRKKYEEAILEFRRAIQLGAEDAAARSHLGDLLSHFGRWDEAEIEYRKVEQMESQWAYRENHIRNLSSRTEDRKDKLDQARDSYRLNPNDRKAKLDYLLCLFLYGYDLFYFKTPDEYEEATKVFEEALKINPKEIEDPFYLACCYAALGEKEKAIKSLQDGVKNGFNDWSKWVRNRELDGIRADPRVREMEKTVKERWKKISARPIIYGRL